ncbi:transposase family protein [Streptomyces scopuliridis]|uniref:transposase family protein n=1 Tax=Streptomyces scopuliridis TaxID=452529 RepID=UPI0036A3634C
MSWPVLAPWAAGGVRPVTAPRRTADSPLGGIAASRRPAAPHAARARACGQGQEPTARGRLRADEGDAVLRVEADQEHVTTLRCQIRMTTTGTVPASPSSPMPDGLGQLARTTSPQPLSDAVCLARFLAGLPDPRGRRGRRFPLVAIVAAASASVLAGARSLTAIAAWIADAPRWVLLALGFVVDPFSRAITVPRPTTVMRLLKRLDGDAFDAVICAFLQARSAPGHRRAVAVDGKVLRGSRRAGGKAVWVLAAMDHAGTVLGSGGSMTRATSPPPSSRC